MRYLSAIVSFNGVVEGGEDLEDLSRRWNLHLKDSRSQKNNIGSGQIIATSAEVTPNAPRIVISWVMGPL